MEHLRTPLAFAIVCVSLLCAAPASATTYYCDNDRSASQYPNCSNYNDRFVYRSGQSGDWNGDDRLGSSGSGAYSWRFQGVGGGNTYNFQAWLNNAAFTTPSAEYGVNSDTIR